MTFNIGYGGESRGQPLQQTVEVIKAANVDIIGIQENYGKLVNRHRQNNIKKLADMLG